MGFGLFNSRFRFGEGMPGGIVVDVSNDHLARKLDWPIGLWCTMNESDRVLAWIGGDGAFIGTTVQ
jgi:hypothetical protein